eukprot:GFUD01019059.1.p1 GENE.GFUD01019059.1~~GFUD01019059.1.p1  ORF type:complete len:352 (-),score=73.85 GFUD01019059.1:131-1186(-)
MASSFLVPVSDQPYSGNYHQVTSWKITEEAWNKDEPLILGLGTRIPGTCNECHNGGFIKRFGGKQGFIGLVSCWPKEVKEENIRIEMTFSVKKGSEVRLVWKSLVSSKGWFPKSPGMNYKWMINVDRTTRLYPTELDLYDENKTFFLEAEILILKKNPEAFDSINAPFKFLRDMKSIMELEEISDFRIVCCGKVIKCHKIILCARSGVFKNMLSGDTLENLKREVPIEDSSSEAVEEMLKYIYTGEIPDSDKLDVLNIELLHLAEKYHLDTLKFACGGSIVSSLTVSNCISSFISVERYFPPDSWVRKRIDVFLRCNAEQVIESEGLDDLVKKVPELLRDLMRAMIKGRKE